MRAHVFRKRGEVLRSFPRKTEFVGLVRACFEKALREIDGYTLSQWDVPIVFYAKGNTAGRMKWDGDADDGTLIFNIEFSIDAIAKDWDHMTQETIPHEIAHIVDVFIHDGKSNHHNAVWKRYARALGCRGDRCHSIATDRARRKSVKRRVQYIVDCGTEVWLTMNMHNKIQRGAWRVLKANQARITASHCTGRVKVV